MNPAAGRTTGEPGFALSGGVGVSGELPFPDPAVVEAALARLRRVAAEMPLLDYDEPGAVDDLLEEIGWWAPLRAEAKRAMLGDEPDLF